MDRHRVAAALLAAVVALGACGSDGDPSPSAADGPTTTLTGTVVVQSGSFEPGSAIDVRHTCDGDDTAPALAWVLDAPDAASLTVEVIDVDAPDGPFLHWRVTDIPTLVSGFGEGGEPPGIVDVNDFGEAAYRGPCPPPGDPQHQYLFVVSALDADGDVVAEGSTFAFFARPAVAGGDAPGSDGPAE